MSNSQLYQLKSGIKDSTEVTLNLSSNVIDNSNGEANSSQKLLLTDGQVSRLFTLLQIIDQLMQNYKLKLPKMEQLSRFMSDLPKLSKDLRKILLNGGYDINQLWVPEC